MLLTATSSCGLQVGVTVVRHSHPMTVSSCQPSASAPCLAALPPPPSPSLPPRCFSMCPPPYTHFLSWCSWCAERAWAPTVLSSRDLFTSADSGDAFLSLMASESCSTFWDNRKSVLRRVRNLLPPPSGWPVASWLGHFLGKLKTQFFQPEITVKQIYPGAELSWDLPAGL